MRISFEVFFAVVCNAVGPTELAGSKRKIFIRSRNVRVGPIAGHLLAEVGQLNKLFRSKSLKFTLKRFPSNSQIEKSLQDGSGSEPCSLFGKNPKPCESKLSKALIVHDKQHAADDCGKSASCVRIASLRN